ncbi:unnamed protein product [Pieris macdunnoughi]|uniref:F-box domain-containing protein n=1 Tax=Pieris macdunnoughi TaxID=345717 RepID=A0A821RQK8_9NEOP|nr:unnamed protein product [Pieris macdunnoughi]
MSELSLEKLPPEILLNIVKRLNLSDIGNLILTSKYIKAFIINESYLWKLISQDRLIISRNIPTLSWYHRCRISYNWCKGIFKSKVIIQHKINYMPWMQLLSPNILLVSFGSDLVCFLLEHSGFNRKLLWKLTVPTMERFDVRTNDISRFIVKDNMIVCGNRDGSCAMYEFHDIKIKPVLLNYIQNCHNFGLEEVTAVEKWKNCIVTASYISPDLHFWRMRNIGCSDTSPNENVIFKKLKIPECIGCRSLTTDSTETKMAVGLNGNIMPVFIDLNTGQYLIAPKSGTRTLNHVVRDIKWHNESGVVYVTHSGKLQYIDVRTGGLTYETRDPFDSSLYCLKSDGDKAVVTGSSEYSRCVLYDMRSTHHVQMYFTQKRSTPIYSLEFDAKKLIAAGDQRVAVINFNVNSSTTKAKNYSYIFQFVSSRR